MKTLILLTASLFIATISFAQIGGSCQKCGPGFKKQKVILSASQFTSLSALVDKYSSLTGGQEGEDVTGGQEGEDYTDFLNELQGILTPEQFGTFSSTKIISGITETLEVVLAGCRAILGFNHDTGKFE
ncbi:MAG: hypothetical protein IH946_06130 [Bacteroidetes bacterium]|nr:hypothetical protein [Bacteroidota bacterium]